MTAPKVTAEGAGLRDQQAPAPPPTPRPGQRRRAPAVADGAAHVGRDESALQTPGAEVGVPIRPASVGGPRPDHHHRGPPEAR
jgi:hypothetical protein